MGGPKWFARLLKLGYDLLSGYDIARDILVSATSITQLLWGGPGHWTLSFGPLQPTEYRFVCRLLRFIIIANWTNTKTHRIEQERLLVGLENNWEMPAVELSISRRGRSHNPGISGCDQHNLWAINSGCEALKKMVTLQLIFRLSSNRNFQMMYYELS